MSPQLSTRCAFALLFAIVLASSLGLLALGPLPYAGPSGGSADLGSLAAALLHLPLLAVAVAGWRASRQAALQPSLRAGWKLAAAAFGLAALSGVAEALAPSAATCLVARLPMASAAALCVLIFLAERLHPAWASRTALWLAAAAGPLTGWLAWAGGGDARSLLWVEHLPLLLLPLGIWGLASRGLAARDWLIALLAYAGALVLVWVDLPLGALMLGSPALQPLLLAAGCGWLALALTRQAGAAAMSAPASQRSTSLNTAG